MPLSIIPAWKESPFLRLLPPFIAGILLQWYLPLPVVWCWIIIIVTSTALMALQLASVHLRFKLRYITGILLNILIILCASIVTWYHHPAHIPDALITRYNNVQMIKAVLQEPLSQKKNSHKATASARELYHDGKITKTTGNIIIYFSRAVDPREISYGSIIIINKQLQPVKSSGNPGSFDYHRYCTFNHANFQVYLQPGEFSITGGSETRGLKKFIFYCREQVIGVLRNYIKGPQEAALAEALLIGYKDELDQELVQAYSNTGVVHIIAVSGMHLGIIYWLLSLLVKPFRKNSTKWINAVIILAGLWAFSLLAGAGPSVIRSAFMFSLIVIGETFSKRNSIYNNLAASAFMLLCWNPYWLWDVGFQLSYAAVLSIVLFFRPIYNLVYVQNKLLDAVWKLNAVTLSAQILTIPLSIYHFHQFPNLFVIANLLAVPLSSLLLLGELVLCAFCFIPIIARWIGELLNFLLEFLNNFIQKINAIPFASWTHLQINVSQVILLYAFIAATTIWFSVKDRKSLLAGLCILCTFVILRTHSFVAAFAQKKLIVYNIPKHPAIDFIEGRKYYFEGDPAVQSDKMLRNFHVEPSRTLHRISETFSLPGLIGSDGFFSFHGKRILIMTAKKTVNILQGTQIDVLVLSQNPRLPLRDILQSLRVSQVVADASNSNRNISLWRRQCEEIHIPFHSVADQGAYTLAFP
ncbi:MAG TPA: ComEC/Rec2 family competence protein [Chitinophagaceae bacterium]